MSRPRIILAVALVVGAGLFVVGTRGEAHHHDEGSPAATSPSGAEGTPSGEAAEHPAASAPNESAGTHQTESGTETGEKVLGVNPEAAPLVGAVVVVSLGLAGLVLWRRAKPVVFIAIALCSLAVVADISELVRQLDRSKAALAAVAAAVALAHAIGAAAGTVEARTPGIDATI